MTPLATPWEILSVCLLIFAALTVAVLHRPAWWLLAGMGAAMTVSLALGDPVAAYLVAAGGALLHAARSPWPPPRR